MLKWSLGGKPVVANAAVIVGIAAGGVRLAYNHDLPIVILIICLITSGFTAIVVASGVILRRYFQPLLDFRNAVHRSQTGQPKQEGWRRAGASRIRERIRLVRGMLNIDSAAGMRTRIRVVVPIALQDDGRPVELEVTGSDPQHLVFESARCAEC